MRCTKIDLAPYLNLLIIINAEICFPLRYLIAHIVVTGRLLYAQMWKLLQVPLEDALIQKLQDYIEMDRLTSSLKNELDELFKAKWSNVYTFLKLYLNYVT